VGISAEHVALTASTTDGCNIVLAGLGLGPEDELITTTDEHFGPRSARPPLPESSSSSRSPIGSWPVTPEHARIAVSQVLWTTASTLASPASR
jgi:hypothetical protein